MTLEIPHQRTTAILVWKVYCHMHWGFYSWVWFKKQMNKPVTLSNEETYHPDQLWSKSPISAIVAQPWGQFTSYQLSYSPFCCALKHGTNGKAGPPVKRGLKWYCLGMRSKRGAPPYGWRGQLLVGFCTGNFSCWCRRLVLRRNVCKVGTVIPVVFLGYFYMTRLFLSHRDLRLHDTEFSVKMITNEEEGLKLQLSCFLYSNHDNNNTLHNTKGGKSAWNQ